MILVDAGYIGEVAEVPRCPLCGETQSSVLFESQDWIHELPGRFPLKQCIRCSCVYPDPRPKDDALPAYYPEDGYYAYTLATPHRLFARRGVAARVWYSTVRGLLRHYYGYTHFHGSALLASGARRLPFLYNRATFSLGVLLHPYRPNGALLDVGCGSGRYLDLMRALGWQRVVGVDINAAAVSAARQSLGLDAYCGDLRDVGFPDATFDAVSMSHTLEHLGDPVALLTEIHRVTKPGGRIAIQVPNAQSMLSRIFREHWVGLETPRHLVNFSRLGLHISLVKAGLSIESLETSPQGSYGVALFSGSRQRDDPREVYTDERHKFAVDRRAVAALLALVERVLCSIGFQVGELLCAVARR